MKCVRCYTCVAIVTVALTGLPSSLLAQPPKKQAPKAQKKAPPKPVAAAEKTPPPPPDLVIATKYVTGDKSTTTTVSIRGARERIDYGNGMAALQQCDAKRTIQINDKTKTFLTTPYDDATVVPPLPPGTKAKGGQITFTTTTTDTGEKKDVFGYTARHIKTAMVKEATPTACNKKPEKVETDGWYIDLPPGVACSGAPARISEVRVDPQQSDCRDEVRLVQTAEIPVGYPVSYTMVSSSGTATPVSTTMEVTELNRVVVPPDRVDVPPDYLEVQSVAQLTADHRPGEVGVKKPGIIRVGVAPVANRTDQQLATDRISEALSESLGETELEVVLLHGSTPSDLDADAKSKECDYVLNNTVSELKKPGKGVLGKIAGSSSESFAAKVDYALARPGEKKPAFAASEHSGSSTLHTAVGAATRVAKLVSPFLLPQLAMMNAFAAMSSGASPAAMLQTPDPVLNSVFALIDRATKSKPAEFHSSEESAVAAALEKEVQAVSGELLKKKKL